MVFVNSNKEVVGATGHISTRPVPRSTFTRPSPLTVDPTSVLVDRSTVNSRFDAHSITKKIDRKLS